MKQSQGLIQCAAVLGCFYLWFLSISNTHSTWQLSSYTFCYDKLPQSILTECPKTAVCAASSRRQPHYQKSYRQSDHRLAEHSNNCIFNMMPIIMVSIYKILSADRKSVV